MKDLSDLPAAQLWQAGILRGVYPEGSEWAKNDNSARLRRRFLPTAGRHSSQRRLFDSMEGNIAEYLFCQDLLEPKIFP
jgi:hypothetical protein